MNLPFNLEAAKTGAYARSLAAESRAKHYGDGYQDGWNSALGAAAEAVESLGNGHHAEVYSDTIRTLKRRS